MKQGLSLRTSQHLALTPQLQQSIRLLQLSTLELSSEVEQMLDDNPFLEREQEEAAREEFGVAQADTPVRDDDYVAPVSVTDTGSDTEASDESSALDDLSSSWDGDGSVDMSPNDSEWGGDAPARGQDEDTADATELARSQESLSAYLHRQALSLRLSPLEAQVLGFLIESLNDDGYLEDKLEDLALGLVTGRGASAGEDLTEQQQEQLEVLTHHFEMALRLLQSLEPVGVGARDLGECLALQIKALQAQQMSTDDDDEPTHRSELLGLALQIVQQPMDLLARRDTKKLVIATRGTEAQVREALGLIARLEPKPGRRFVDVSRQVVVPDVLVRAVGSNPMRFRVALNTDVMPKLRVHDIYANALKGHKAGSHEAAGMAALQQRLQEARWFIKNIQQRFDTILRVSEAIVERQKNFFVHGELAMRPLVLREIADALGLHESTISRVTTAKYMATPYGTFELKYFFGSGLGTDSGANASSTAVRALIKQFVAAENVKKPLSDNQIAEMLKEQGIDCARRTVAKYREALKIAPANLRKSL